MPREVSKRVHGLEPGDPVTWFRSVGGRTQFIQGTYVGLPPKGNPAISVRVRVRSPDGVESVRTVMRENVEHGHRNALGKLLPVLALCLSVSACKAKRPELHPCNSLPPDAYPSWCMGTHRQLPPETRRLYPPSPSPRPNGPGNR